jgi:hypothetical protein
MPTVDERLRHVQLKVERAEQHIAALSLELDAFLQSGPYRVEATHDAKTRKLVYFVAAAEPVPDSVALIAGDAIQNLMSALDHLAYQIVCSDTRGKPPDLSGIYFPIADDAAKYEANKRTQLKGASQETFQRIDAVKPYRGGKDPLWALKRLNNIEKHRLLLAVGSRAAGLNLGQLMAPHIAGKMPPEAVAAFESMNIFLNPADKGFPLRPGFELYIGAVDEKPNPKQEFRFDVALSEPGIIEGPLLQILNGFTSVVSEVVTALTPCLR